uniref:EF-hand domain-containing protein n=1 Tax=Oryza punctata TaxID=4537 RepID=A0A0E0KKM4_ORYPU
MSQFVATFEYCSLAVSVSSLLIRFVLHPLVKDAIILIMSRAGVSSVSCALLGLLTHDDSALVAAGAAVVVEPPPLRRECELCARREGVAGLSRHDVAAVVASLGMVAGEDDDDEDDDEACGVCEAVAAVEELTEGKVAGEGELREAFYVFDRDEDGYVSAAELWNVLRRLGMEEGARYGDCVRMIAAYDGDGDGRISFQEFRAMMENALVSSIDRVLVVSVSSLLIMLAFRSLVKIKDAILVIRGVRAVSHALVHVDEDYRYCAAADADAAIVQPPRLHCCADRSGGVDDGGAAAARLSRHDVAAIMESLGLVMAGQNEAPCGACEAVAAVEELTESKVAGEGELREAFRVFDRDGDGYVSAAELRSVLRRLGMEEGARHDDCVRMIAAHDGDGDGRISFQEFRAMMENAKTHHQLDDPEFTQWSSTPAPPWRLGRKRSRRQHDRRSATAAPALSPSNSDALYAKHKPKAAVASRHLISFSKPTSPIRWPLAPPLPQ